MLVLVLLVLLVVRALLVLVLALMLALVLMLVLVLLTLRSVRLWRAYHVLASPPAVSAARSPTVIHSTSRPCPAHPAQSPRGRG